MTLTVFDVAAAVINLQNFTGLAQPNPITVVQAIQATGQVTVGATVADAAAAVEVLDNTNDASASILDQYDIVAAATALPDPNAAPL